MTRKYDHNLANLDKDYFLTYLVKCNSNQNVSALKPNATQ